MNSFFQTSFYVLLFFGIYGTTALLFWIAHLLNKSCDAYDEAHKEERAAFQAACEIADRRDLAKKLEKQRQRP